MPFVRIAQSLRRHSLPESVEIAAIGVRLSHHLDGQKKSAYGFGSLGDNPPGLDELEIVSVCSSSFHLICTDRTISQPFTVTMLPQHGGLVPGGSVIITVNVPPEYFGRVSATLVAVTEVCARNYNPFYWPDSLYYRFRLRKLVLEPFLSTTHS